LIDAINTGKLPMPDEFEYEAFVAEQKKELQMRLEKALDSCIGADGGKAAVSREEITRIKFALRRIDERQYGLCCNCGCGIEHELLRALPETPWCESCREELVVRH
jgi:hypothetical protein